MISDVERRRLQHVIYM